MSEHHSAFAPDSTPPSSSLSAALAASFSISASIILRRLRSSLVSLFLTNICLFSSESELLLLDLLPKNDENPPLDEFIELCRSDEDDDEDVD